MNYALFLGCAIPSRLPAYAASTRAVLQHLGVTLLDLDFNCCGYPARDVSRDAFVRPLRATWRWPSGLA